MEDSLSSGSSERGQLTYIDDTGRVRDGERPDATSTSFLRVAVHRIHLLVRGNTPYVTFNHK